MFTDARVGLRVQYVAGGRLALANINSAATIAYHGEADASGSFDARSGEILPGKNATIDIAGVGVGYGHFVVRKRINPASSSPIVAFTCMLDDASPGNSFSCIATS